METEKYRLNKATGQVYEYIEKNQGYLFAGELKGRTLKQFIADYEEIPAEEEIDYSQYMD